MVCGSGRGKLDCEPVVVMVAVNLMVIVFVVLDLIAPVIVSVVLVFAIGFVVVFVVVVPWKQVWTLIANQGPVVVCCQWQVE